MRRALSISVMALVLVAGCKKHEGQTAVNSPAPYAISSQQTPEQLGEIGAAIKKQPAKADQILTAHGMDEKSFEAAIRKVTESPADSKRYAAAFKKAS